MARLALLAAVAGLCAVAGAEPFQTLPNHLLFFPASLLVTNGAPGLSDPPARLMVAGVSNTSERGGSVSLVTTQAWACYYPGSTLGLHQATRIAVDNDGNVVVAGPSASDFATVKYGPDGAAVWTNRYAGPAARNDLVTGLALDGLGNAYVTGYSMNTNGVYDAATIKYSPNGMPLWTNRFNDSVSNGAAPQGLVADADGNAFLLVGNFYVVSGVPRCTLLKYDPAGNLAWVRHYNDPANIEDNPVALARTPSGDLVVACSSQGSPTGEDYAVLKYTSDGDCLWTNRYDRRFLDQPASLALDPAGNVVVTGDSLDPSPHLYVTIRYGSDGQPLWTNLLTGPRYQGGAVPQVVSDLAGNSFVSAGAPGATNTGDFLLLKIDPNGVPLWTNRYLGLGATNGILCQTATDSAGNLYTAGYTVPPGEPLTTCVLARYAADGTPVWTNRFDGPPNSAAYGFALAVSPAGDIHVTGQVVSGSRYQFATVKFVDYVRYTPPAGFTGTDSVTFTVTDSAGNRATNVLPVTVLAPSMRLQPLSGDVSGGFGLLVTGAADQWPVVLYASTNLVDWQAIATNSSVQGTSEFHDPAPVASSRRFYRVAQ